MFMADAMATSSVPPYLGYGNIGGRFYMNLSVSASLAAVFGVTGKRFVNMTEEVFGRLPEGMDIPLLPLPRRRILRLLLPVAIRTVRRARADLRRMPEFLAAAPARCESLRAGIRAKTGVDGLLELWKRELLPFFHDCCLMLGAAGRQGGGALVTVRRKLKKLVGETDANSLLTGLGSGSGELASLGPLVGLTKLLRGEIDRDTFARQYGHRSPHEFEVSIARPAEDPEWIERQLAGLREAGQDVSALLARQERAREAVWQRLRERYPQREPAMRRRIERWVEAARSRETARTEVIRAFGVVRDFLLRVGEITAVGDDIFFLSIDEIVALLNGDESSLSGIPARREAYGRYCALPSYPAIIRGHFDPFRWAADPERRSDVYDERGNGTAAGAGKGIAGFPGAAGVVEGRARVIFSPQEGEQLQPGEILVTTVTNIGWTPIFPRAAAVVTDVGAPLSHAAIVARELGIPAVVGCGNATMRLRTGDRVRVNGEAGTVEVLPG
jgi:pyruvate,water dikinase